MLYDYLVGGFNSLKYMKVSWDYYSQYMESHKIPWFQSPPTSNHYHIYSNVITVILSAVCIAVVMPI